MIVFLNKHQKVIVMAIFLALAGHVLLYTYMYATPFVRADGWRFIDIYLVPLWNNKLQWQDLWSDAHPWPLAAIFYIVNAKYLGLNLLYETIVSAGFKIIFALLLSRYYIQSLGKLSYFYLLPIYFVIFSLNSTQEYTWSLVTILNVEFVLIFIYFGFMGRIIQSFNNNLEFKKIAFTLLYYLAILICDYDTIMVFSAGVLFTLGIVWIFNKEKRRILLTFIIGMVLIIVIYKIFMMIELGAYTKVIATNASFSNLFDLTFVMPALVQSIGASVFPLYSSHLSTLQNNLFFYASIILTFFYIVAFIVYIKNKMYNITLIPLIMLFFHFFLFIAIVLYRSNEIVAPRYTGMYQIGLVGYIWIYTLYLSRFAPNLKLKKIVILAFVSISCIQLLYIKPAWGYAYSLKKVSDKFVQNLYAIQESKSLDGLELEKSLCGKSFSVDKVGFLSEHNLNIFSDNLKNKYKFNIKDEISKKQEN